MIDISTWMDKFLEKINQAFGERIWFVGLQGSYGRCEATETSDIDVVVILDTLSAIDIQAYNSMLDTLPHRDLICGFFAGKCELLNWEPSDLFQFYFDTTPIKGTMEELLELFDPYTVNRAIKIGVCNIYHGCVHNMLHEKSVEILRGLYKAASFAVQAICYQQTGIYIRHQNKLRDMVSSEDREIIDTFLKIKDGSEIDFLSMSETLFAWSQKQINQTETT